MSAVLEPQSPVLSDAALVERVIQRDSTALIELERRHRGSLYAQAYAALADATYDEESRERYLRLEQLYLALANAEEPIEVHASPLPADATEPSPQHLN